LAVQLAEAGIAVSSEHGLVLYQAVATVIRGWALIAQDRYYEAVEQIQQGLADYQATGTELLRTHFSALLAEALHKAGKTLEALHVLEEALAAVDRNGERYYQAELYRLKGELLLHQSTNRTVAHAVAGGRTVVKIQLPAVANAEACFHQSIKISRQQGSNSLELRSVMSMARLYQNQGKQEEARNLLAEIYGKFTEGFETKDLREAKALLDDLTRCL
jgi:predicted ATPase